MSSGAWSRHWLKVVALCGFAIGTRGTVLLLEESAARAAAAIFTLWRHAHGAWTRARCPCVEAR